MNEQVVVSASWLAGSLDDPGVRVIDVRDAWEFDGIGHVPGAVNVPFERFRSDGDDDAGMLPGADAWAALLGEAGVGDDDTLVAYDDTHGVFAARFLVTAALYGHEDVRLLDGDYSAWNRDHATTTGTAAIEATTYEVREPVESPLVDYETVLGVVDGDDPDTVVVDTREAWEFEEGHLPGAVHVDWRDAVDEGTRGLKPRDELLSLFAEAGVTPDRRILLYCNTARRISHTYLVLRHLGFDDVAFYEGSLTEWEARGGPVV
jgi:thiosulfate/3-mercaptopyruvate sulfurtransferase